MLRLIRFRALVLALLLGTLTQPLLAGNKLQQIRKDARRIQQGTLLVPPVLVDSLLVQRYLRQGKTDKVDAHKALVREANVQLREAVRESYTFSKVVFLDSISTYKAYFEALSRYDADKYFVLQSGHMAQYAGDTWNKASRYDKNFIGIYRLDGRTRMVLGEGKLKLMDRPGYLNQCITALNRNLGRYAKLPKSKGEDAAPVPLLAPLAGKVEVVGRDRLYGKDSTTFMGQEWQTVVTTQPITVYRAFGGQARMTGTFVSPEPLRDTLLAREQLAILRDWGNDLHFEAVIQVPTGTRLQIGFAGPQPVPPAQALLPGGGGQIILPYQWPATWVTEVSEFGTGRRYTPEEFRQLHPELCK